MDAAIASYLTVFILISLFVAAIEQMVIIVIFRLLISHSVIQRLLHNLVTALCQLSVGPLFGKFLGFRQCWRYTTVTAELPTLLR